MACTSVLPPTRASICDIDINYGEIAVLFLTLYGDGLTDVTDETEWNTRTDNTTAQVAQDPALIRTLFGIGSLGDPETTETKVSRRRKSFGTPKFSFLFKVDDTGDTNWAWMRAIPVGGQTFTGWFGTETKLFGGNDGIAITIRPLPSIPESNEEMMLINVTASFEGSVPEMNDMPAIDALTA